MNTILCNMCLVTREDGEFLVLDRLPKPGNPWCGLTFPGGHVEPGEDLITSVQREVREESGLDLHEVTFCGWVQWYHPENQSNYLVFLFRSADFSGELINSPEGNVSWRFREEFLAGHLAPNMKKYLAVLENPQLMQAFGISGQSLKLIDNRGEIFTDN